MPTCFLATDRGWDAITSIAEGAQRWLSVVLRDALDDPGREQSEASGFEPGAQGCEGIGSVGSDAVA